MSTKIKGFYVSLELDVSEEFAEHLKKAILLMRYVQDCEDIEVDHDDWMNRSRITHEVRLKMYEVLKDL